ncbi:ATP-binding protein [Streptomyces sp. 5K101]|uniref:ATP-binding protein n=1 Tax=Streptomyces sp. 5K101 TaxID=3390037 RepID=UPI003974939A
MKTTTLAVERPPAFEAGHVPRAVPPLHKVPEPGDEVVALAPQPGTTPSSSELVDTHDAILALPAEVPWVPIARRSAAAVLAHWGIPDTESDVVELIIGELAANAAQHGRSDMTLRLSLTAGALRISVTDSGDDTEPRPPRSQDPDEHGRGLDLVALLAHETHVHQDTRGRRVNVVLRSDAAAA